MQDNVYLIGLMGAGKTTVGRRLARLLKFDFIDTDQLLEEKTGVTIGHIFEIEGEEGFRERESRLLAEISDNVSTVISTGGGMILREDNRKLMRKSGQVVYLKAGLEVLWKRLKDCQNRPLLSTENPRQTITDLLNERDPLYQNEADLVIQVNSDSAQKTAMKIFDQLHSRKYE